MQQQWAHIFINESFSQTQTEGFGSMDFLHEIKQSNRKKLLKGKNVSLLLHQVMKKLFSLN